VYKDQFMNFAADNGIAFETPVDRMLGMTKTAIPIGAAGEFSEIGLFGIAEDG
jgi:hypothetical protein